MNFGLAFSFVFKDKDWFKKVALPALCSLIPIVGGFVVSGWALKVAKNVIEGNQENALPELTFGADLGRGFKAAVISLIYSLPVAILAGIGGGLLGTGTANESTVPIIFGACFLLIGLLVGLLIAFLGVVGMANFVAKDQFGSAFKFSELFKMLKKSFGSWLLVLLGQILAMGLIAPLGTIACGIGAVLTAAYGLAFSNHLLGQAYNKSTQPGALEVETF
jgi:hypothetical protein